MKKTFLISAILLFAFSAVNAQHPTVKPEKKFFLGVSAGPSFPVGAFGSKDTANAEAGFAKTGFNVNLQFGYQLNPNFAIASTVMYSKYTLDLGKFDLFGAYVKTDHWQYYGILAGPMATFPLGKKAAWNVKAMAGITNANSPRVDILNGVAIMKEDWSTAFTMQLGTDFRYNVTDNFFLFGNVDYSIMKPKFTITVPDNEGTEYTHKAEQKMGMLNVTAGVGVNF